MHSVVKEGLVHVVYANEADMQPELQKAVLATIERELRCGAVAVVFTVKQAGGVDSSVPAFWMKVARDHAPTLCAVAVSSPSMVVRAAASAFSFANRLRQVPVRVRSFESENDAMSWAQTQLQSMQRAA